MHIRFNTTAAATVDWQGETLRFQKKKKKKKDMAQLASMFHEMVDEARGMLEELTMVVKGEIGQLPAIRGTASRTTTASSGTGIGFWPTIEMNGRGTAMGK